MNRHRDGRRAGLAAAILLVAAGCGARERPATTPATGAPAGRPGEMVDVGEAAGRAAMVGALAETLTANVLEADDSSAEALRRLTSERDRLLAAGSPEEFYGELNRVLRAGGNPHVYVYRPGRDLFDQEVEENWLLGATLHHVNGYRFVDDIWEGSPAQEAGLLYGDELLPIDGEVPVLDPLPDGTRAVRLWVRRARDAEPFFMDVEAMNGDTVWFLAESTRASIRTVDRNGCRVGVIRLQTFADEALIDELITGAHFDLADALVIDLRGNRGGEVRLAGEVFDLLSRLPSLSIHYHDRQYSFPPTSWNRPVAVLVDGRTHSAAEIFAASVQVLRLGTVVGTPTAGRVQASRLFPLPDGSRLLLPVSRVTLPDGSDLEGRGVMPDERIERPLMYAGGADPPLERALEILEPELACLQELPPERFPQEDLEPDGDTN